MDWRKSMVGGSDAHTLSSLGLTFTEVAGATSTTDFLIGLRHGLARAHGASGNYAKLTRTVAEIGIMFLRENPWAAPLAPLLLAVPVVTLVNFAREMLFERKWSSRVLDQFIRIPATHPLLEVTDVGQ
jgi:hypothetical protein